MRHDANMSKLERIIRGEIKAPYLCRLFEDVSWSARDEALRDLGLRPIASASWHEVSRGSAIELLTNSLGFDLCYGTKRLAASDAKSTAEDFVGRLHWQSRYFTNSDIPWSPGLETWSWSGLSTNSTMDTGVIARTGKFLVGILWTFSWD